MHGYGYPDFPHAPNPPTPDTPADAQRWQEARRRRRERIAAASEALCPTDEILADLQLRERLALDR